MRLRSQTCSKLLRSRDVEVETTVEGDPVIAARRLHRDVAQAHVFGYFLWEAFEGIAKAAAATALQGVDVAGIQGDAVELAVWGIHLGAVRAVDEDAVGEGGLTAFDAPGGALGALDLGVEVDRGERLGGAVDTQTAPL